MEARRIHPSWGMAIVLLVLLSSTTFAQLGHNQQHVAQSQNFIVFASTPQLAARVSKTAETHRRELAQYWLGKELSAWSERCPIHVQTGPRMGAGGETRFSLISGGVGNWGMSIQGTEERVLDSVLPHEITHTIFATHFAPYDKYVPRWADEGACTTVEHVAEKSKHEYFLQEFLRTRRGISFNKMFSLKDYPNDILPLYAQGHSVVQFLLDQGGPRKFVAFLEDGMRTGAWEAAMSRSYDYKTLGELQLLWNKWLADGSPENLVAYAPSLKRNGTDAPVALATASSPATSSDQFASEPLTDKPAVNLVAGSTNLSSLNQANPSVQTAGYATGPSWYRQRLREVTSNAPSENPSVASNAASDKLAATRAASNLRATANSTYPAGERDFPLQAYQPVNQATAMPRAPQSPGVQVLDWGASQPVAGLSSQTQMVPLLR